MNNSVKCCICGKTVEEKDTVQIFTGRRQYICLKCAKKRDAQGEKSDINRMYRLRGHFKNG